MEKFKLDLSFKTIINNPLIVKTFYNDLITNIKEKNKDIIYTSSTNFYFDFRMNYLYNSTAYYNNSKEKYIISTDKIEKDRLFELIKIKFEIDRLIFERDFLINIKLIKFYKKEKYLNKYLSSYNNVENIVISKESAKNKKIIIKFIDSKISSLEKRIDDYRKLSKFQYYKIKTLSRKIIENDYWSYINNEDISEVYYDLLTFYGNQYLKDIRQIEYMKILRKKYE